MAILSNLKFWLTKRTSYDAFAEEFAQTREKPWPEADIFRELITLEMEVLDAGCGNGRNIPLLTAAGATVTGVDASVELLAHARKQNTNAKLIQGQVEALPFSMNSFDAVFSTAVLHHLPNHKLRILVFFEAIRVLKPGGIFTGTVWNLRQERFVDTRKQAKRRTKYLLWWKSEDLVIPWGEKRLPRLYHTFSPKSLQAYLKQAGFTDIELFSVVDGKKAAVLDGKNICFVAKKPRRITMLDIPFDMVDFDEALDRMHKATTSEVQTVCTTPNPEICVYARNHPEYRELLQQADLSVPDAMGILWAGEFLHTEKKNRFFSLLRFFLHRKSRFFVAPVCGSDLFREFCQTSQEPIFLLGGVPGVAEKCAEAFREFGAQIVDTDAGKATADDEERIIKKINASGAKALFVAFGAPKQEEWIFRNKGKLPNVRLLMGVGGSFDFVAGTQVRAPQIFRKAGLEWLWRLLREPSRLKRIYTAVCVFPRLVQEK